MGSEMCIRDRGVGDLLDHNAQQRAGDDGGAHSSDRAKAQLIHHEPGHVRTNHNDIAMGKVQQQDDAVHHAVTQCDQCIDAAKGQAVDQLAKKHCHGLILPFFAAFARLLGNALFYQKSGDGRAKPVPAVSAMGLLFLSAAFMPHTGAQNQSRSEHFLQNGGCTVEAQDSGLLDGVVVLIEGEGAGDAIDGAACDSIDDGLLIVCLLYTSPSPRDS